MRRFYLAGFAAFLGLATPAFALKIAMPAPATIQQKMMQSDAVVVGKVQSLEKETIELTQFEGATNKVPYIVANVKIETALMGAKNVTHVKVVFPKPGEANTGGGEPGGGRPIRPLPGRGGFQPITLTEEQEGVFFLVKHPTSAGHYIIQQGHTPINATDANYKDELGKLKVVSGTFQNPEKALAADKIEDRVTAALTLAQKYRSYPQNNPTGMIEETPIKEEESKLMVKVLLDADWTKTDAHKVADALGLLPGQYGIPDVLPGDGEDLNAVRAKAFKAWHEKFGAKFTVSKISAKTLTAKPK